MPISEAILKTDLETKDIYDFFIAHVAHSRCWYFSEYLGIADDKLLDITDIFKNCVSIGFKVGFQSAQIVGSAKTGFSLSPDRIFGKFDNGDKSSDIDVAIISESKFYEIRDIIKKAEVQPLEKRFFNNILKTMFFGHVNLFDLCNIASIKDDWIRIEDSVRKSLQDKMAITHPINYRIYRTWEDLEEYHLQSIEKVRKKLLGV